MIRSKECIIKGYHHYWSASSLSTSLLTSSKPITAPSAIFTSIRSPLLTPMSTKQKGSGILLPFKKSSYYCDYFHERGVLIAYQVSIFSFKLHCNLILDPFKGIALLKLEFDLGIFIYLRLLRGTLQFCLESRIWAICWWLVTGISYESIISSYFFLNTLLSSALISSATWSTSES